MCKKKMNPWWMDPIPLWCFKPVRLSIPIPKNNLKQCAMQWFLYFYRRCKASVPRWVRVNSVLSWDSSVSEKQLPMPKTETNIEQCIDSFIYIGDARLQCRAGLGSTPGLHLPLRDCGIPAVLEEIPQFSEKGAGFIPHFFKSSAGFQERNV